MNNTTNLLIKHKADFTVAVLDDDDAHVLVDARTLDRERLKACLGEAPEVTDAAVFYFALTGELWYTQDPEVWLMHYVGAYADTAEGLRDTLAKLTDRVHISGVASGLTTQDRLDAWSTHLALFDQMQPSFPFTVDYSALVDFIKEELADTDEDIK